MQDPYDLDSIFTYFSVEYGMLLYPIFKISGSDVITGFTSVGRALQEVKRMIQSRKIYVPLSDASGLGISTNIYHISFSQIGQIKRHDLSVVQFVQQCIKRIFRSATFLPLFQ